MSRIIVKNLPKSITAKKLENLFSSKGEITDLQLKYNKEGVFRQFAFVGYKTEEEAKAAKEYFNNTFVNTSRIQVDICASLSDPNKPKAWKKQSFSTIHVDEPKNEEQKEPKTSKKKKDKEIPEELMKDPKFKEFLKVNRDRKKKPVWAEDIDVTSESDSENEVVGSSSDSDYDTNYKKSIKKDTSNSNEMHQSEDEVKKNAEYITTEADILDTTASSEKPSPKKGSFDNSFTVKIKNLPRKCKKKQIKQFFHPLKIVSLRIPPKIKRFAYVKFKAERDMKQALNKNKGYLEGQQVDVVKYTKKEIEESQSKNKEQVENTKEENEELLAETGRIFVRNLCFSVTEKEIEEHFSKYGSIAEIHIPMDFVTKKAQGFAFVSYTFAEHAVKAFTELDGTIFQGRVLHLIPAKPKKEYVIDENEMSFKKRKELKAKLLSGSSHNWNILFLGMNSIADAIAEKYSIEKSKLLSGDDKESLAVRMALAETEMVMENRKFLIQNGVQLDAFSQASVERSKTVIVVKHLPAKASEKELYELFSKFGELERVVLPPSGLVALIEFKHPAEAKTAFKKLAYSRFHQLPLYLEWAPINGLKTPPPPSLSEAKVDETENTEEQGKQPSQEEQGKQPSQLSEADEDVPPSSTTVFVKSINFCTTQENFLKHFKQCGPITYAAISTRPDVKTGKKLSMGFGFVQFKNRESAVNAIQNLQQSKLDGHALELKFANQQAKAMPAIKRKKYEVKKQLSSKILVRNIPFEASEKEVKELFKQFGMLRLVRLPTKLDGSGGHRGFGFVEYFTKDNAARAFNALCHSTHLYGRRLVLEWANPDSEDVDELRKKTASRYLDVEPKKQLKKRKLNEDVVLAAARFEKEGMDEEE